MEDDPRPEPEFVLEPAVNEGAVRDQYVGAFFPRAHNFVVSGGRFKTITNIHHAASTVPSGTQLQWTDFRIVPRGDLDLLHEIQLDCESGVVYRRNERRTLRKVHSARIHGSKSPMTVAVYQGDNAEEEWKCDISKHANLCHPNFVQIYGIASSTGIRATIIHGGMQAQLDLVYYKHVISKYRDTPAGIVYIYRFLANEYSCANEYFKAITGEYLVVCALSSRPAAPMTTLWAATYVHRSSAPSWNHVNIRKSLIHCRSKTMKFINGLSPIIPGVKDRHRSEFDSVKVELCELDGLEAIDSGKCVNLSGIKGVFAKFRFDHYYALPMFGAWLCQANHIFGSLDITSDFENYFFVRSMEYRLLVSSARDTLPQGFLFLCPATDLQTGDGILFRHPGCPAYWSLDPAGVQRLSPDAAKELGFPDIELDVTVIGCYWDTGIYTDLRKFYRAKGFKPDSQDIARKLGHSLYQASRDFQVPFAHIQATENSECTYSDCDGEDVEGEDLNQHNGPNEVPRRREDLSDEYSMDTKLLHFLASDLSLSVEYHRSKQRFGHSTTPNEELGNLSYRSQYASAGSLHYSHAWNITEANEDSLTPSVRPQFRCLLEQDPWLANRSVPEFNATTAGFASYQAGDPTEQYGELRDANYPVQPTNGGVQLVIENAQNSALRRTRESDGGDDPREQTVKRGKYRRISLFEDLLEIESNFFKTDYYVSLTIHIYKEFNPDRARPHFLCPRVAATGTGIPVTVMAQAETSPRPMFQAPEPKSPLVQLRSANCPQYIKGFQSGQKYRKIFSLNLSNFNSGLRKRKGKKVRAKHRYSVILPPNLPRQKTQVYHDAALAPPSSPPTISSSNIGPGEQYDKLERLTISLRIE
ncbi:hypothetical protein GGX14DRAFT_657922 [Mycena pura]|uniref:Protein kinase domain-containing protein n=1 Tax=Mycena pura TaxID=153505 RepID=A0AAD6YM21_9AGAR|nr:hypothetical protein GGX14DRAFT_657922 [Mycena pura]